eukprot:714160-Rhodomonas_salina.2
MQFRERVGEMRLLAMDPDLLAEGMAERKLRMTRDLEDQLTALQQRGKQLQRLAALGIPVLRLWVYAGGMAALYVFGERVRGCYVRSTDATAGVPGADAGAATGRGPLPRAHRAQGRTVLCLSSA